MGAYQLAITIGLLLAAVIDSVTTGLNNTEPDRVPIVVRRVSFHTIHQSDRNPVTDETRTEFAWALIPGTGRRLLPTPNTSPFGQAGQT